MRDVKGKIQFKHVMTSGFQADLWEGDRAHDRSGDSADSGTEDPAEEKIPEYTLEDLNKLKVGQLKDICQKFNIRRGPAPRSSSTACPFPDPPLFLVFRLFCFLSTFSHS
jgi:hypothetical protein